MPYPIRNMLRRWRGMLGMMIGVGIALSIVLTMLAMTTASVDLYTSDFKRAGSDLYVIQQGGTLIPVFPSDTPGTVKHARHTITQIRALPEVRSALGVMTWAMEREREGPRRGDRPAEMIPAMGVDGDPTFIPQVLDLKQGRWLRRGDEVVIGPKLSREKKLTLGDSLRLNERDFTVVGIGKLRGFGFGGDSTAYLDYRAFRQRADIGDVFTVIAVDTVQAEETRRQVLELGSLAVSSPQDLVRQTEQVYASSVAFSWIFSLLALAIGALFIANMLARSVAERRLEFATLRAIGIPARTILLAVGGEAIFISLLSALFGLALSLLFGWLINSTLAVEYGIETLFNVDAGLFTLAFGMALGLGLVSGVFPARQATRVDPVEVLREA
jgi:ABC-type lipoprotein release transport system permease subunit